MRGHEVSLDILVRSIPPMKRRRIAQYLQKNHSTKMNGRYRIYKYLVAMVFPLFFFCLTTTPPKSHHSKHSKGFRYCNSRAIMGVGPTSLQDDLRALIGDPSKMDSPSLPVIQEFKGIICYMYLSDLQGCINLH